MNKIQKSDKTMGNVFLQVHSIIPCSRANGPGLRFTIWMQGCSAHCPGCCNPQTHDPNAGIRYSILYLLDLIGEAETRISGITISGGEPTDQAEGLAFFLKQLRNRYPTLNVILFSGYQKDEIRMRQSGLQILSLIDVLVDGRYQIANSQKVFPYSSNQKLWFFSNRLKSSDFQNLILSEVIISERGEMEISGYPLPLT